MSKCNTNRRRCWHCPSNLAPRAPNYRAAGTSRKAYRLGKFLQHVNALRRTQLTSGSSALQLLAYGGDGLYYFIDQAVWLCKAGLLNKALEKKLSRAGAVCEAAGFLGSLALHTLKLQVTCCACCFNRVLPSSFFSPRFGFLCMPVLIRERLATHRKGYLADGKGDANCIQPSICASKSRYHRKH